MTGFLTHLVRRAIEPSAGVQPWRPNPFESVQLEPHTYPEGPLELGFNRTASRYETARVPLEHGDESTSGEPVHANWGAARAARGDVTWQPAPELASTIEATTVVADAKQGRTPRATVTPTSPLESTGKTVKAPDARHAIGHLELPTLDSSQAPLAPRQPVDTVKQETRDGETLAPASRVELHGNPPATAELRPPKNTLEPSPTVAILRPATLEVSESLAVWPQREVRRQDREKRDSTERNPTADGQRSRPSQSAAVSMALVQPLLGLPRPPEAPVHWQRSEPEPTVHVTIGTIEVRALVAAPQLGAKPSKQATPARPIMSLSEYLKRRNEGRR